MTTVSGPHPGPPSLADRAGRMVAAVAPRRFDWPMLAAVAALSAISCVLVWSATYDPADPDGALGFVRRQALHLAVGAVALLVTAAVDFRVSRAYAPVVYLAAVLGLALVLTAAGRDHQRFALLAGGGRIADAARRDRQAGPGAGRGDAAG